MSSSIKTVFFWTLAVLFFYLIVPEAALAWGPGTHVETSIYIFRHLALLAPAVRALIKKHPSAFIYGSVCPDMVLGKRYMAAEMNNHQWIQGRKIWDGAETDRQKSFALGYLSHLAADTVAHNHFVPDRLLDQFSSRGGSHMLQELYFDSIMEDEVWVMARDASRKNFQECEALLERNLPRTPFPRIVNKKVFRSGIFILRVGGWQRMIRQVRKSCRLDLAEMMPYLQKVHRLTLDYLRDMDSAECLAESPTGGEVLPRAEVLRATLQDLHRHSRLRPELYTEMVGSFHKWRDSYFVAGPEVDK